MLLLNKLEHAVVVYDVAVFVVVPATEVFTNPGNYNWFLSPYKEKSINDSGKNACGAKRYKDVKLIHKMVYLKGENIKKGFKRMKIDVK